MLKKESRLWELLQCIPPECNVLADVGCDHGKLTVAAVKENRCKKAIGLDISQTSLMKAERLALLHGVESKTVFLVSDGLEKVNEPIDVAIIAGMGANEIIHIIQNAPPINTYILCPHQDVEVLRGFLSGKFEIKKDFIVKENDKFYPVICAETKNDGNIRFYSEEEIFLGKNLPERVAFDEKNTRRYEYLKNLFETKKISGSEKTVKEYEVLQKWQQSRK